VRSASEVKTSGRVAALADAFDDPDAARLRAAEIKAYVVDNLKPLLLQLESKCEANGIRVHWAKDAESARQIILGIAQIAAPGGGVVVKAKSMATEEIHLNPFLEQNGFKPVETDLGEYVVQLDGDTPSHIVTPIIHKNRRQVADAFEREGLGLRSDDPATLAMQARERLRSYFQQAKVGISGVNFAVAETGRLVLVENEGNNRLSTTAPDVHIALMGMEKVLPREADLPLFLRLLSCSATAQQMTSYVHLISGPRKNEIDGPTEVHLVILDNGRSRVLNGPYRDILRCIRCGACLNVCPVYRQVSGHGYGHVYSGPLGAVLAPALEGVEKMGYLSKASSLCGACEEVCPVQIPIPRMLLQLRDEAYREGVIKDPAPWGLYAKGATSDWKWRLGLKLLPMASQLPHPLKGNWEESRTVPQRVGRSFRKWWNARS
jgi:L-lactate dehydrogenase complex protein LldF